MASRIPSLACAPGVGTGPGDEQNAAARQWRKRLRHAGGRLHQSDPAALGGGGCKEEGRDILVRRGLSQPGQSMLARAAAVPVQTYGDPDSATAGRKGDAFQ